jgi:hypothetical protein
MKHINNIRDKVGIRSDNPGVGAKKLSGEDKGIVILDKKKDSIEIGKGVENAGVGAGRATGREMGVSHIDRSNDTAGKVAEDDPIGTKKAGADEKKTWIKGSVGSKKNSGSQNVKGKL